MDTSSSCGLVLYYTNIGPSILFKCNAFKSVLPFVVLHIVTPQNNGHIMLKPPHISLENDSYLSFRLSNLN